MARVFERLCQGAGGMSGRRFSIASELGATPEALWRHATSPEGVNRELLPLLRMTFPRGARDLTEGCRPGRRLFRSWLLLGGWLPVDWDDVVFEEIEPGRRYLERSTLLSHRCWEHERILEPIPTGCRLTDRLRFVPRVAWLGPLYAPVFATVFRWRHRQLRRLFGAAGVGDGGRASGSSGSSSHPAGAAGGAP